MSGFSFFKASPRGASGTIRCNQIGDFLGAKINPTEGYEDDVCIYVKFPPQNPITEKTYLDLVDNYRIKRWLRRHQDIKLIVPTDEGKDILWQMFRRDDAIVIPQHHCNFDREKRRHHSVRVAGVIGSSSACDWDVEDLSRRLAMMRVKLIWYPNPTRRSAVIDFYKSIDVQIVYRSSKVADGSAACLTPLKIINAGSFGIPTVAMPEPSFNVVEGCYLPVFRKRELLSAIWQLKRDWNLYEVISEKARFVAEEYHIENIAKIYRKLLKEEEDGSSKCEDLGEVPYSSGRYPAIVPVAGRCESDPYCGTVW